MTTFNAESTADEVLEGIDLTGKRVLITGSSGGLGKEAARAMAAKGAEVILAARNPEKLAAAQADIAASTGSDKVSTLVLDLASLAQVREAAAQFLSRYDQLDMLINNAGIMATPFEKTKDGFESQFGVCHMGHFLFTCLVAPALVKAGNARVVNLSSGGHKIAPVNFEDPNYENRDYNNWESYGQAKTANVLFSVELDKRLAGQGVRSFAVHPGAIAETDLSRHMTMDDYTALTEMLPVGKEQVYKSLGAGAATSVWAATSASLDTKGGIYLEDCSIGELIADDDSTADGGCRAWARDEGNAAKLWQLSEQLVGETFNF